MTNLPTIKQRARGVLDGMTVNREIFARDVLAPCEAAVRMREEVLRLQSRMGSACKHADGPGNLLGDFFRASSTRRDP